MSNNVRFFLHNKYLINQQTCKEQNNDNSKDTKTLYDQNSKKMI